MAATSIGISLYTSGAVFLLALNIASITLAIAILALAIIQSWMVDRYCRALMNCWLARDKTTSDESEYAPAAAVIVCLRGDDPSLHQCLIGLAQQEYPDFQLYAVADHANDPAIETFNRVREKFDRAPRLVTMYEIAKQRTLKCSALLTAFDAIRQDDYQPEVIALLDSDVDCDPRWLSDLVGPMQFPQVGGTTGNRWFEPAGNEFGSWMRQVWNSAAVVQMHHYKIAWGGSLAFRESLTSEEKFLEPLRTGFCEDTGMKQVLATFDLDLVRIPSLIMSSAESTTAGKCLSFITRQLLSTKLYHGKWSLVAAHGLLIPFYNVAALVILFLSLVWGFSLTHALPLIALVVFQVVNLYLLGRIGRVNRMWLRERGRGVNGKSSVLNYLLSVFAIQFVHANAVLAAIFKQKFCWRQVEYQVKSSNDVSMLQYQPFHPLTSDDRSIE